MSQKAVTILIGLMELALLAFTASRTLDLLQQLLPANQAIFAWLGLVAFDGGLVGWSLFFSYGARGAYQRAITVIMVVVSLVAIGISVIADLIISASAKGIVDAMPEQGRMAVLVAVGGIVFLNVAAFFLTFITEPERLRQMAIESAKDKIHAKTLQQIALKADTHAPAMADELSEQWVSEAYAQMGLTRRATRPQVGAPPPSSAHPAPLLPDLDHHNVYTGEFRAVTADDLKTGSEGSQNGHATFRP